MLYGELPYEAESEREFASKMEGSLNFKANVIVSDRVKELLGKML